MVKAAEKALETCVKNPTCRTGMNQMGVPIGLTNAQIEEAMKAGATRDPAIIAKLTPEQIAYLDAQIKSGTGMAGLILGNITWGDRLATSESASGEGTNNPNMGANLSDKEKTELGGTGSGTPGGWEPQDEENARKQQDNAKFDTAKERYPKQYEQYSKLPDKNLEKAISEHDKQIAEHQGYLNDPARRQQHVPNWDKLSSQHQENLLHHWQQDIKRHESYKSIAEGILRSRK